MITFCMYQTRLTEFLPWNTNIEVLMNVHAALFHTLKVNGDQYSKKNAQKKAQYKYHKNSPYESLIW